MKVRENKNVYLYRILLVLAGIAALFPVSCNYIMNGGIVAEWVTRVRELASGLQAGKIYLFPSADTFAVTGIKVNGMNSNFWFFVPGILYQLSGSIVFAYRIFMLAVQVGTLLFSMLLFRRIFADRETKLPVFFGVLLYMTCPYRIYVCYDLANLCQTVAWMLLPLYVWAMVEVMGTGKKQWAVAAAFALAGIGYADTVFFLIAAGITLLTGLILRKFLSFASVAAGGAIFLPGLYRLVRYLFLGDFQELDMPIRSIMQGGYRLGEFFSSYSFRNGHPGVGMGILACLLAGIWLRFVQNKRENDKISVIFVVISAFFAMLSLRYFPWDVLQRLGNWSLLLISLIDTPAIFWGMASFGFCVPAASAVERVSRHDDKLIKFAIPVMIMLACFGICVYQCNTLMYNRLPLE